MHASARSLSVVLPLALGCAAARNPTPVQAPAPSAAVEDAASPRPSARPAFERVLEVLATPAMDGAGCELTRLDARGEGVLVRVVLDVDVKGTDAAAVTAQYERLLEALRAMQGARTVSVRSSSSEGTLIVRLQGVSIELDAGAPPASGVAADANLMTSLRALAASRETRLGGVDIGRRGDDDDSLDVRAHTPGAGQRLERLRSYMAAIETQLPGASVVRISLRPGSRGEGQGADDAPLYHWQIEVERDA